MTSTSMLRCVSLAVLVVLVILNTHATAWTWQQDNDYDVNEHDIVDGIHDNRNHNGGGNDGDGATPNIVFLPPETEAACLDGSPYAFWFVHGSPDNSRWTISINGGGCK